MLVEIILLWKTRAYVARRLVGSKPEAEGEVGWARSEVFGSAETPSDE